MICREIANLTLFNTDIEITGNNELQKRFDRVMNDLTGETRGKTVRPVE